MKILDDPLELLLKWTWLRKHHPSKTCLSMKLSNRWIHGLAFLGLHPKQGDPWLPLRRLPRPRWEHKLNQANQPPLRPRPSIQVAGAVRNDRNWWQTLRENLEPPGVSHSSRFPTNLKASTMSIDWSEHWRHIRVKIWVVRYQGMIIVLKDQATPNFLLKTKMESLYLTTESEDRRVKMVLLGFSVAYDVEVITSHPQFVQASRVLKGKITTRREPQSPPLIWVRLRTGAPTAMI